MLRKLIRRFAKRYLFKINEDILDFDVLSKEKKSDYFSACKDVVDKGFIWDLFKIEIEKSKLRQLELCQNLSVKVTEAELERVRREGMMMMWTMIDNFSKKEFIDEKFDKFEIT